MLTLWELVNAAVQDSCKEGRQGTPYSTGLSRQRMPSAAVTMENSRENRADTFLLLLV